MGMTRAQLDAAVWGSGYGGKKHLVDRKRSQLQAPGAVGAYDDIRARCSAGITLAVVDTWDPVGSRFGEGLLAELERREPCSRCREIAEAQGTPIYRQTSVGQHRAA
jgi:hypothetical protein